MKREDKDRLCRGKKVEKNHVGSFMQHYVHMLLSDFVFLESPYLDHVPLVVLQMPITAKVSTEV